MTNENINLKLEDGWLEIGTILTPQGLDGKVRVYPNSDFPERFEEPGQRWLLRQGETEPQPIELLAGDYIPSKNLYVVELAGVESRNQAEALRGCKLMVPESDRPELGEDEYHILDLIDLEVFNQLTGETVGVVVDLISGGNDVLVVKVIGTEEETTKKGKKHREIFIPFVKAIVPVVNLQERRIEITPPAGLLELN
jgi:16S rRNA processing protein RimM